MKTFAVAVLLPLLLAACDGHDDSTRPAPSVTDAPPGHIAGRATPCGGPKGVPSGYVLTVTLEKATAAHEVVAVQKVKYPFDFRFVVPAADYIIRVPGDRPVYVSLSPGGSERANVPTACL